MKYHKFLTIILMLITTPAAWANPIKHLIIKNDGIRNQVLAHHLVEISFKSHIVWTSLPSFGTSFREVLGQSDSAYQRVVDSEIQSFSGLYETGSITAKVHNNMPPYNNQSIVTTCKNVKPIHGYFHNVVISIDLNKKCTIEEYNIDLK